MGGESEAAWRGVLDDLIARGLRSPEFLIIDGAAGLERALAALWPEVPTQRCTVHKHRNLLAHAPDALHEEISADYNDMIYAKAVKEIETRRKSFVRKWRLKCRAVADSLEEAGERLFTFTRLPESQWKSARTTNAIERLHEEFKRRIKTQTVLPSAETAAMLFWAELAKVPSAQPMESKRRGCSLQDRSPCAKSTAGRRFPRNSLLNALTWQLDPTILNVSETSPNRISTQLATAPPVSRKAGLRNEEGDDNMNASPYGPDQVPMSTISGSLRHGKPTFTENKLVGSDPSVGAAQTDANLINPWGVSESATGSFWISDNGTGLASIYGVAGGIVTTNVIPPVTIAPPAGQSGPAAPDGQVFNAFAAQGAFQGPSAFPAQGCVCSDVVQAASKMRWRSRSNLARPHIVRLIVFR
jgi:hypothetical protein